MSRFVSLALEQGTRAELEPSVLALAAGEEVLYLGLRGESSTLAHTWRIGAYVNPVNPAYVPEPVDKPVHSRKDTAIYKRELYTGSGRPVGPVDFSRPEPEPERQAFPAPLVRATIEHEGMAVRPTPIAELDVLARAHGWETMITYAHGWVPHASYGTPSKEAKESWAVRLRRGAFRGAAVRMDNSWSSLWTWSDAERFTHHKALEDFVGAVTGTLVRYPSRAEWDKMLACFPKRPTRKEREAMEALA